MMNMISILGAGTMGSGLARLFAANESLRVTLYDPDPAALTRTTDRLAGAAGGRLTTTSEWSEAVAGAQLVIEAGPERLDIKRDIFRQIAPYLSEEAVVATNTSTFPLETLADGQPFADRMVVVHFFNPADLVPLVEIVGLPTTRSGIADELAELLRNCGKTPVVLAKDCPGFIANRLQAAVFREALHLLESGVADAAQIDAAMTNGPGLRWALYGPFATADFGGLDIWERVADHLFPQLGGGTAAPEAIAANVREGKLGLKTGSGFYEYGSAAEREQLVADWRDRLQNVLRHVKEEEG